MNARWYEEVRGGHKWVLRGSERVSGANRNFSRTVYLRPTENFKLRVTGVTPSPGKRRISYYWVNCIDDPYYKVKTYKSTNFSNLNTWFKADDYQRWYWAGCACWVVVNPRDKEILLLDGYVSKATLGANNNYNYDRTERKRVAKFVNLLRSFVSKNYRVVGILGSHRHADHVGDIPYILGGLKADNIRNFMNSGIALTGRAYKEQVKVVYNRETFKNRDYGDPKYDDNYYKPRESDVYFPQFNGSDKTDGKNFATGKRFTLGHFGIEPYIWDHGNIPDGGVGARGPLRTLAYRIWRQGGTNRAIVFFTSGFCEDRRFANTINRTFDCHHVIFAWSGHEHTGDAAKRINLLPNSPVGRNYIFTNHTDNNSNAGDMRNGRREVIDMFGMFIERGVIDYNYDCIKNEVKWGGKKRTIQLGVFGNRLGVD